jgi:hypothetical protein
LAKISNRFSLVGLFFGQITFHSDRLLDGQTTGVRRNAVKQFQKGPESRNLGFAELFDIFSFICSCDYDTEVNDQNIHQVVQLGAIYVRVCFVSLSYACAGYLTHPNRLLVIKSIL